MNRKNQIPNSVYVTLGSGFVLGAIFMAGLAFEGTGGFSKAQGQSSLPNFEPRTISAPSRESTAEVKNLDAFYANLAAFVSPAVVDIRATSGREMSADGTRVPVSGGEGSGFILRPDGYIITNDHVVAGFDNVKVILKDGREFDGKVTRAHESDIAVIKINATNLPTLAFGDSDKLKPGQMAMAVGSPFSFQQSVTFGHISALGRERTQIEDRSYPDMIQTDTAINMGNSGGPLCNIDGQVVGLNTAIYSPSGTSAGIGLAIPSNEVRLIADKLIEKGKVVRSFIGVAPMNLTDYQKQQRHVSGGALVQEARESDPAGMAGVRKDDIIVRVGQTAVNTQMDLRNSMLQYAPGSSVDLEVIRGSEHKTFKVKLGEYKDPGLQGNSSRGFQRGQQGSPQFHFPGNPEEFFKDFPGIQGTPGQRQPRQKTTPVSPDGKPHLGVGVGNITDEVRSQYSIPSNVKGAVVGEVTPGSIAESLGIQTGDVIQSFDGRPIQSASDLTSAISGVSVGDSKRIAFKRYGAGSVMTFEMDAKF